MTETEVIPMWRLLAPSLAMLVPLGLALVALAALPEREARQGALAPLAAFALGILGYVATGFALHYGGIGLVFDHPDLGKLVWEWSALSEDWGATWGMAGLAGFGGVTRQPPLAALLLFSALAAVVAATLLPTLALRGRAPAVVVGLFALLTAAIGYPLVGNWVQGGGWLANLGFNIGAGHGFVDFGSSSLFVLGGGVALAGILIFLDRLPKEQGPAVLPPIHLPLLAVAGAGLVLAGSTAWMLAWPLTDWSHVSAVDASLNVLLAAAAGGVAPLSYTWFVAGHPDPLQGARGVVGGWVAGLAAAPFMTPGAAVLVGLVAGFLVLFAGFLLDRVLRLQDKGGILSMLAIPAMVGLLAVGLVADGAAGMGYNGVGAASYLNVAGQGVTGRWLLGEGFVMDWPGQLLAQAIGVAVIFLGAFLVTSVLAVPLVLLARAWGRVRPAELELADADAVAPAIEEEAASVVVPATAEELTA